MELATQSPQDVNAELGSLFSYLNRLDEFQETVLELIPVATDEQLLQTKERGEALGHAGWKIVAACNSEIKKRTAKLKGGRGNTDEAQEGRVAVMKDRAVKIEKSDAQVYRDAQIFDTFKTILTDQNSLLKEKGYYEQALRTPQPKQTIKIFEREKINNASFSVNDAKRLAATIRDQRDPVVVPAVKDYVEPNLKAFLLELENSLQSFSNRCPRVEFKSRIDGWIRATRFERGRTPQSDYESVRRQVDNGACTAEEVMEEVYLAEREIKTIFSRMIELEPHIYEWRPIGAHTEMARGSRAMGIFRKDAPAGDNFETYVPRVEYE